MGILVFLRKSPIARRISLAAITGLKIFAQAFEEVAERSITDWFDNMISPQPAFLLISSINSARDSMVSRFVENAAR